MRYRKCKTWREIQSENNRRWKGYIASTDYCHTRQGKHIDRMRAIAAMSRPAENALSAALRSLP